MTVIALLFLAAHPAAAGSAAAVPAPKPELICRENEQQTGSHIHSSRSCKTAEQWAIEDARRGRLPITMRVTEGQDAGPERSH